MDEENVPGAGTAQPAEGQSEGSQGAPAPAGKGAEARIAELTAERYAEKARADANERMTQELLQKVDQLTAAAHTSRQPQTEEDVDFSQFGEQGPAFGAALKKALDAQARTLREQFGQQYQQLASQMELGVVRAAATGLPEAIRQRAEDVLIGSKQRGVPLVPEDALNWAIGEAVRSGKYNPATMRRSENPGLGGLGGGSLGPPPPAPTQQSVALPTNFEELSPQQQDAWMTKNKVDDIPI